MAERCVSTGSAKPQPSSCTCTRTRLSAKVNVRVMCVGRPCRTALPTASCATPENLHFGFRAKRLGFPHDFQPALQELVNPRAFHQALERTGQPARQRVTGPQRQHQAPGLRQAETGNFSRSAQTIEHEGMFVVQGGVLGALELHGDPSETLSETIVDFSGQPVALLVDGGLLRQFREPDHLEGKGNVAGKHGRGSAAPWRPTGDFR